MVNFGKHLPVPYIERIEIHDVLDEELEAPGFVEFGNVIEQFALDKIAKDLKARESALDGTMYASEENPWMRATLDGWITEANGKRTPVELKSTAYEDRWRDGVPENVHAQVQHQMAVMDVDRIIVGVVFRVSCEGRFAEVTRSDEFIGDVLIPAEEKFWRHVVEQNPRGLEIDGSEATRKALEILHGSDIESNELAILSAEADDWAYEIQAIGEKVKALKDRQRLLKNHIANEIGSAPMGALPSARYFRFKTQQRKAYEVGPKSIRPLLGPFGRETT